MSIRVVGLGGTYRPHSSTEQALKLALAACAARGAEVELFGAEALDLPMYRPSMVAGGTPTPTAALRMIDAVRAADGVIIASPATTAASPAW